MSSAERKEDHLLTIMEVARRLRVQDTTVRRWITNGSLEAIGLPRVNNRQSFRVKESTIARLLGE